MLGRVTEPAPYKCHRRYAGILRASNPKPGIERQCLLSIQLRLTPRLPPSSAPAYDVARPFGESGDHHLTVTPRHPAALTECSSRFLLSYATFYNIDPFTHFSLAPYPENRLGLSPVSSFEPAHPRLTQPNTFHSVFDLFARHSLRFPTPLSPFVLLDLNPNIYRTVRRTPAPNLRRLIAVSDYARHCECQ